MNKSLRIWVPLLVVVATFTIFPLIRADTTFKAGVTRKEITPKTPVPLWGYAARRDTLSQGVQDPLYVTALVLQVQKEKLAIISLDLGRAPSEKVLQNIRRRILSDAGIKHSFVTATHTHHGPVLELSDEEGKGKGRFDAAIQYVQELEEAIVSSTLEANRQLTPVKLAVGTMPLDKFAYNRQSEIESSPVSESLSILRLEEYSGQPLALIVNFAAHPTMLPPSLLKFSADYVGVLRNEVEQQIPAKVLFLQGAAGDQSPYDRFPEGFRGFGKALADAVVKFSSGLKATEVPQPLLAYREQRFTFPARIDLNDSATRKQCDKLFFPELVANFADEYQKGVSPRLTVALLNRELAFVGVSGEVFCGHRDRLQERLRAKHLFFLGYCNGYHQYFPSIEAVAEGGYGTRPIESPVAVGAGEQIMNTALVWLYEMMEKLPSSSAGK